jgi:hypothetical protein
VTWPTFKGLLEKTAPQVEVVSGALARTMAQWLGQYSGRTHETKVHDLEESLRVAIDALHGASAEEQPRKTKAVHQFAEKLLSARSKALGAKIALLLEPGTKATDAEKVSRLRARAMELQASGVAGILREFGFQPTND